MKFELNKNLFILDGGQVILTSDEEIKIGDVVYNTHPYGIKVFKVLKNMAGLNNPFVAKPFWSKIIAAYLKLEGVPLLNLPQKETYTEQDIINAVNAGAGMWDKEGWVDIDGYIQALKQPKIQSIELQEEYFGSFGWFDLHPDRSAATKRLKIINKTDTNPDGEVVIKELK